MIRYYAYYSCGGYKDLYLGNSSLKTEYTYFLPLYATWVKGTKQEYAEKLKKVEGLPQIEVISKENYFDFPKQAKLLFSHGGYRIIYLTLFNGDTCLCVRDITNGAKDEEDRDIPFNILITASGKDNVKVLDQFCLDSLKQPDGFYGLMHSLFSYDPQVNGIKFHLGKLNSSIYDASVPNIELDHKPNHVNFLIIDSAAMASMALHELNLDREQIDYIKSMDGKCCGSLEYKEHPVAEENLCESKEVSPLETMPVKRLNHVSHNDESPKQESLDGLSSIREDELYQQFINIQSDLRELMRQVKNIGEKLDSSESSSSFNVEKIMKKIDLLKNEISLAVPIIPELPKEDNSISISKISLWIAGVALIVGFLLGALIF